MSRELLSLVDAEATIPSPQAVDGAVNGRVTIRADALNIWRPAIEWARSTPENLPLLKEKLRRILAPTARFSAAASSVGRLESSDERPQKPQPVEVEANHVAGSIFSWTGGMLAGIGETVALLFLLLASGGRFMQKLVEAMPTFRDNKHAVEISREYLPRRAGESTAPD